MLDAAPRGNGRRVRPRSAAPLLADSSESDRSPLCDRRDLVGELAREAQAHGVRADLALRLWVETGDFDVTRDYLRRFRGWALWAWRWDQDQCSLRG